MRDFHETEHEARLRAEVDPETRDRITYAHDLLGRALSVAPAELRRMGRQGAIFDVSDVARAGLTLGEAQAAGMRLGYA